MHETALLSTNGRDFLHIVVWEPKTEIKAILQISHGMVEYVKRYNEFAEYLNEFGILVVGNDHLGHGQTAKPKDLGYFGSEKSEVVVDDLHEVMTGVKSVYGNQIPYFLFGHSMGSFMARRFLMTYGDKLNGAILSGTGYQPWITIGGGKLIASIIQCFRGERYRSDFLKKMAFGSYNKRISDSKSPNAWLTKEESIVQAYDKDPYCTFNFTVNGYQTLFDVLSFIQKKGNVNNIPDNLPILMISGQEDPVGGYGKGVEKVYEQMKNAGISNLTLRMFPTDRHELTNETDRYDVYETVKNWILVGA